jgi:hypothetical protein
MPNINTEALKHAANKGCILQLLQPEYPDPVDFAVLRQAMANMGKPLMERDLAGYLCYLEEDGYVELGRDTDQYILYAKLKNKGHNILDGLIKDPAILVG